MTEKKYSLKADQILVERNFSATQGSNSKRGSDDHGDGSDGTSDSYAGVMPKLRSTYTVVNGEGSDGDTDGSESDGEDARF